MKKAKKTARAKMKIDGLPVVDAGKRVVITISEVDVKKGASKSPGSCAAARACVRQLSGVDQARVHLGRIYLKTNKNWQRYRTPEAIRNEIISFDRGGGFTPGDYVLTPMSPINNRMAASGPNRDKGKSKRLPYHIVTGVRAHARG